MEGPGVGIIRFALFADHPLQAAKEVPLESGVGIHFCVVTKGSIPLAAAVEFVAPDRRKDGAEEIGFILVGYAGEVVNGEDMDVRIHFFDEVAFVRQLPDLR